MQPITDFLSNPIVVGTTLTLIGLHQFSGPLPMFNNMFSMEFGTLPLIGGVTPMKVLGTLAVGSGLVMLFTKRDTITSGEFMSLSAEMIEGARAHGHL